MTFKKFFKYMTFCSVIWTAIATIIAGIGLVTYGYWLNENDTKNLEAEKTQDLN